MIPRRQSLLPDFPDRGLRPLSLARIFSAALSRGAAMKAGTEADSMQERPTTFGELLRRFVPSTIGTTQTATRNQGQLSWAASAVPLTGGDPLPHNPLSVVLHSVTTRGLRLTHAQPLRTKHVAVRLSMVTGEALQVLLSLGRSRKKGSLYETQAEFIQNENHAYSSLLGIGASSESGRQHVASVGNGD